MTTADTLADAFGEADRYFIAVSDPRDHVEVRPTGDEALTIVYHGPHETEPIVGEFAASLLLTLASSAAGRPLVPTRVRLPGTAADRHRYLAEAYGTRAIDFGAPRPMRGWLDRLYAEVAEHYQRTVPDAR